METAEQCPIQTQDSHASRDRSSHKHQDQMDAIDQDPIKTQALYANGDRSSYNNQDSRMLVSCALQHPRIHMPTGSEALTTTRSQGYGIAVPYNISGFVC